MNEEECAREATLMRVMTYTNARGTRRGKREYAGEATFKRVMTYANARAFGL
jgi:hypothetical protein